MPLRSSEGRPIMQKPSDVYVTQPLLPPLEEFIPYLEQIWESKVLTNGGPFHQQLETRAGRIPRGGAHRAVRQRHHRAGHRAAGAAHHGRGDHDAVLVRRDGAFPALERHQAGVRRHRARNVQSRSGQDRGGHHAHAPRPSCRCTATASLRCRCASRRSPTPTT